MEQLDEPAALSRFIASRLVYRRLGRSGWLLLVPIVVVFALGLPSTALRSARHGGLTTRLGLFVLAAFIEVLVLLAVVIVAIRRTNRALSALDLDEQGRDPNEPARARARDLVTAGHAGLITGSYLPARARLISAPVSTPTSGPPPRWSPSTRAGPPAWACPRSSSATASCPGSSWKRAMICTFGCFHARQDLAGSTFLERLVARRPSRSSSGVIRPQVVAAFPQGDPWPRILPSEKRDRRARRMAASIVVAVGFLSLVSALSDPFRDRLDILRSALSPRTSPRRQPPWPLWAASALSSWPGA